MGKGNLNIRNNRMHEFTISYPEIIINGIFRVFPHTRKFFKALNYLTRHLSIRDVRRNKHKVSIIDIADANYIASGMSYLAGYDQLYTISLLSDRNRTYNPYNRLSSFK